jgi:hypothetical protein
MYLHNLQQDNIFVPSEIKSLSSLTGIPSRKGLENVVISNGKIVNIVSKSYGHISNEIFFKQAEQKLIDVGLDFYKRTINRDDRTFSTDFIFRDTNQFTLKNETDEILPMLRFKNSYDGREKTSGHFGFYRKICSNGLHIANAEIAFSIKHSRNCTEMILPSIDRLFRKFLDNEYYSILQKFEQMKTVEVIDPKVFVKSVLDEVKLFRYDCSDKNGDPSKKSREVLEILSSEAIALNEKQNLWLGYNAFNSVLHNSLKKGFTQQEKLDNLLFETIYEMA